MPSNWVCSLWSSCPKQLSICPYLLTNDVLFRIVFLDAIIVYKLWYFTTEQKSYGFLYKLIEDQFIPLIDPYINELLAKTQGFRCSICGTLALSLPMVLRSVSKVLIKSCSDEHLYYLTKSLNKMQAKMIKDITKEQESRKSNQSEERGATMASTGASGQTEKVSIFEVNHGAP